jgi:hypothetical protein
MRKCAVDNHLERPQIWLDEGKSSALFLAAKKGDESFNVHVPPWPFGTAVEQIDN